ncbi:hypothetical protein GCT13_15240 [Paraburkholderia sp. CNPSo 3157]|uniref:YncE family protein n=1 Tax=Paraburkholderia franconis TaxID=2654983 RepID=A0A7X1NAX7_9BURK|nr:hypothetical protein [Paraburkholderia franconis]MPW18231.1 hypothetical protein [Paraburkholderia franconis]
MHASSIVSSAQVAGIVDAYSERPFVAVAAISASVDASARFRSAAKPAIRSTTPRRVISSSMQLAFIACKDNARLLTLNLLTKQVVQSFDVRSDPDALAFDPGSHMLYVAGEADIVSMFAASSPTVSKIAECSIGPGAHVMGVVPSTHRASSR